MHEVHKNLRIGMKSLVVVCALLVSSVAITKPVQADVAGQVVENFQLDDYRGKPFSLRDFDNSRLVLIAFTGTQCPLAKLYTVRLNELAANYDPTDLAVVAINSNVQDSVTEIAASVRRQGITFPVLKDPAHRVADQLGAERTPEVFLLDQNRIVRYHGRIDDQYVVGITRKEPQREDLKEAISELLAGKSVSVSRTDTLGCLIGRRREPKADSPVTYSNQIARIFQNRCVECHREGEIAPFSLTSYDDVVGWGEMISEVIEDRRMPPWHANPKFGHFGNDRSMSKEEQELVHAWVKNGCPEGDPSELPEPIKYTDGWQLSREPDLVVAMRDKPFEVAAEAGPEGIAYRQFWVDPGIKQDKWVVEMEARPSNRAVVHHIIVYVYPEGKESREHAFLTAYVPGLRAEPLPAGAAKKISAGAWFRFEMHYTPIGTVENDLSEVGLVFAAPEDVTHEVKTMSVGNSKFELQPFLAHQEVTAKSGTSPVDLTLLSMSPHMHLRGESFRYDVEYPDGRTETLLDVPNYDFNWQTRYRLAEPLTLPVGARLHCTARFDNSEDNLANPDPSKTITWGDQSWDEMMLGYYDVMLPIDDSEVLEGRLDAKKILNRLDKDRDDFITRKEAESLKILSNAFFLVDTDNSGTVDENELKVAIENLKKR